MISYRIFLNEQLDPQGRHVAWARLGEDAYQPGDTLVLAKTIETQFTTMPDAEDAQNLLNHFFSRYNAGSPDFDETWEHRSLSVGDVVQIGHALYSCENVGWKRQEGGSRV